MTLNFLNPPSKGPRAVRGEAFEFVTELRQHPGRWALYKKGMSASVVTGYRLRYPDITWRGVGNDANRKVDVYAICGKES